MSNNIQEMQNVKSLREVNIKDKRVLIRVDFNVPMDSELNISDDTRIREAIPTINYCIDNGAKSIILVSHLGRPQGRSNEFSLKHILKRLERLLAKDVVFVDNLENAQVTLNTLVDGSIVLLENIRFHEGEEKNNPELSQKLASLCDIYVNDAFGTAHREQATTDGLAREAEVAVAGPLLAKEIHALKKAVAEAKHPLTAVVGGSKVSTKLTILKNLAPKVDTLIVGGGIANTFLLAQGHKIGKSLAEPDLVDECKAVMKIMEEKGGHLPLPIDVVVAHHIGYDAGFRICDLDDIEDDEMILDIGPKTSKLLEPYIKEAKTIIWNGPLGVFEMDNFKEGTRNLAKDIADATANGAFSIVGGGDTIAAAKVFEVADKVSYISTGGGAFLEFLEGKTLPAIAALQERTK